MSSLNSLFQPGAIGSMQMRNRIIMAPMGTLMANDDGTVSDHMCRYYEERAEGGAGLIIVEVTAVAREGKGHARILGIYDDGFIPGLGRLVASVHRHGVPVALQIYHAGRQTTAESAGCQPVAPSPIACPLMKAMPRELSIEEIERLELAFGEGAKRAKEAGFDAVEVHGAHGYLICQFLSAYANNRTDRYGGGLENRMRFALNVLARVKENVGDDYPLLFRISAEEYVPNGLTIREARVLARRLQEAGVHCVDVSAGNYEGMEMMIQPGWVERGCLVPLAQQVKQVVSVPVTVAGRINDPVLANEIIQRGKADFVSLARPLLADPEYPNKAMEGRFEDIRKCTACMHCVDIEIGGAQPLGCAVNAAAGKEEESALCPAGKVKNVLVIGGGVGGMEAARVAAIRGHSVTLYEKEQAPGGQLRIASVPPGKQELGTTAEYLSTQLSRLGVDVRLGKEATAADIARAKPDVVIIAAGSLTVLPDIEGADLPRVALARDVLAGKRTVGQKVLVVGGGRVGCDTAELLASQGKDVTLARMSGRSRLAGDMGPIIRRLYMARLRQAPITIEAEGHVERITTEGALIAREGQLILIKADSVILSPAPHPNDQLAQQLKDVGFEVYTIGDAASPRSIADAIHDGFKVGREI
jgi:2,4-dienoyl-CoA reductase-like NADH-dependent reductase (Old Yellow Enzyme family)/thioredoxin reductase